METDIDMTNNSLICGDMTRQHLILTPYINLSSSATDTTGTLFRSLSAQTQTHVCQPRGQNFPHTEGEIAADVLNEPLPF